jgi:N-acetylmuramic acid 6-phosphate etherase
MTATVTATELASIRYKGLDCWENDDILTAIWEGQVRALSGVAGAVPDLGDAAAAIVRRLGDDRSRLAYAGAGSSGLLAMQDAAELTPTFGWPTDRLVFLMAGGDAARLSPSATGEDDVAAAERDVADANIAATDVVIAVAASGTTPYTVRLVEAAGRCGALTVGLANNPDTPLLKRADHPVLLISGPEVIAGSTRLGAGTAQKAALGMLSTLVMTRLGHVMDGHMVSVVAGNDKLRVRAVRMVGQIAAVSEDTAAAAVDACDGDVKQAALVAHGLTPDAARAALDGCGGNLRLALETTA